MVYSLPANMPRILTFAAKWEPDTLYFQATKAVCATGITEEQKQHIADTAVAVFKLTGCTGYARVDMIMDGKGELNVLEVNPNPDISPGCGAARQAEAAGMTHAQFIEKIVQLALEKKHQWLSMSIP
jgi:D-alanine-D-alanine ligase